MLLITHLMKIYTHEKLHLESNSRPLQDAKNYHILEKIFPLNMK